MEQRNYTYNVDANDFTAGLLDLFQLPQEIPESRLGDYFVRRKDAHTVDFGRGVIFCRKMAADNLEFLHLQGTKRREH